MRAPGPTSFHGKEVGPAARDGATGAAIWIDHNTIATSPRTATSRGASKTVIENTYYENVNDPYTYDTTAASLTQTGSIVVNCTGDQKTNGTTFDPGSHYSYTLDPAADVPALLKQYSDPQPNIGT
ncbi:hypothetical protein [Streptomyces sp. NBC_01235]|uniref:hypothetical protein n=1 Tax=Streptomyces sp. NBC_01235 TaxID=2903788 RepID=UPI002E137D92|nr:hypothetical protein OG289_08025 [Streptomyces sp. NBC_01235]